jgi:uncharacterized membrane protein YvlD (DUF360 family)
MVALLVHWLISAVSLLIVTYILPGIQVRGFGTALIAAIVIGFINATLGLILKILTLPLTLLTFGLFLLVINALMLQLALFRLRILVGLLRRHRAQPCKYDPALAHRLAGGGKAVQNVPAVPIVQYVPGP